MSHTPYDDVFRTLLNDCGSLILPVINEMFGEHYTGEEKIISAPNEHFMDRQDGGEKRITDSSFLVVGETKKRYHIECQSTPDHSMLVRLFEYDSQIALDDGEIRDSVLTVAFPHTDVLYLRHNRNTPEELTVRMTTPGGEVSYPVPVMKAQTYPIEEIFQKDLLFLLPFHIFAFESRFSRYERDRWELEGLKARYEEVMERLEGLRNNGRITEFTAYDLVYLSKKVLDHIAAKYRNVRKGVKEVMGGQVLDVPGARFWREGKAEGKVEEKRNTAIRMLQDGKLSLEDIGRYARLSQEEVRKLAEEVESGSAVAL